MQPTRNQYRATWQLTTSGRLKQVDTRKPAWMGVHDFSETGI